MVQLFGSLSKLLGGLPFSRALLLTCEGLLALSSSLSAQEPFTKALWVGIRSGVHASRYQFVPSVSQNQHIGKQGGLLMRLDIERGASAQFELNYVETGWSERFDNSTTYSVRQLRYIELPILSHLYLGKGSIQIFVNAGPFIGYNISDTHSSGGDGFEPLHIWRQQEKVKYRLAWGLMGGPGISLQLGHRHRFELEGRIAYNFQDIWGHKRTDFYGQSTEFRMGASLSYCFRF